MTDHNLREEVRRQKEVCEQFGAPYSESPDFLKLGISDNVRSGLTPINGLRHQPESGTSGWYIWAGEEMSAEPDFFKPLHIRHLDEYLPGLKKYLGLSPGWRFLADGKGYEDVWFDESLLHE